MYKVETISGTYGSFETPCDVHTYEFSGSTWYAVDGSVNVNRTHETLTDGVNVELVSDFDMFTNDEPIESSDQLEIAADDFMNG